MKPPYRITTRKVKAGLAHDLDFRPVQGRHGVRLRPVLGYNLTEREAQARAEAYIRKYEALQREDMTEAHPASVAGSRSKELALDALLPLFWQSFDLDNRIDHKRPQQIIEQHLAPFFQGRALDTLRYEDGIAYQAQRKAAGAAMGTIQREWTVLMRILNLGVDNQQLNRNPLAGVPKPKGDRRTRVASMEELQAIQAVASEELWRVMLVALNTGLRLHNVFQLKREWVSENGFWISIPPSRSTLKTHPVKLPTNALVVEALRGSESGRVWSWASKHSIEKAWRVACRKAGVVDLKLHDLRHTFATRLQNLGVGYEVRQTLLGHRLASMTHSYSHGGPGWETQLREAVDLLDLDYRQSGVAMTRGDDRHGLQNVVGLQDYKALKRKGKWW